MTSRTETQGHRRQADFPDGAQTRRIALGIEYDGTDFFGWQHQSHARSVQTVVEAAIASVADHPVAVAAAGRTDAGVHALGQVVHFDTIAERSTVAWLRGINSNLPPDVAVRWAVPAAAGFHARYSATSRTYDYVILNSAVAAPLARHRAWWQREPLDDVRMAGAARGFLGEHDFSAFRAAGCQARSPVRTLLTLSVRRDGEYLLIRCSANGFLHHMVRNIVGTLVEVGMGHATTDLPARLLAGADRRLAPPTAPPQGLYLAAVTYPADLAIPGPRAPTPRG